MQNRAVQSYSVSAKTCEHAKQTYETRPALSVSGMYCDQALIVRLQTNAVVNLDSSDLIGDISQPGACAVDRTLATFFVFVTF